MKKKPIKPFGLFMALIFIMACSLPGGGTSQPVEDVSTPEDAMQDKASEEPTAPSDAMPVGADNFCANPYYPVREGSTWNYNVTSTTAPSYSFTDTITSLRSDGFTLTSQYDSLTRTQEWSCTPEGITALSLGGGLSTSMSNLVLETQNASGVTYPATINSGDTWFHKLDFTGTMDIAGESGDASGTTQSNFTALGMESVTVPAGTFNAMKVEVITTFNANVSFQGSTIPVAFTSTSISWFAQGTGWIKTESDSEFAGQASTETIELQWFNIP